MNGRVAAGTILAGKYRLVSLLGRGGMGSVWRAERMGWHAPVAIKLMNAMDVHDSPALARFQREARLAASLRSIHVVQVLDDGVDGTTGVPFIVMELLDGESLAERLSRVKRLRAPVVAQIITQIARALGRAHDAGLIHRDLKPDNILIVRNDDEEIVKVLDFGIAKWMSGPQNQAGGTLAGQMLGTPAYMSPEHFANSSHIDHRADLWSLGVIAYECLVGVRPFLGDTLVSLALNVCSGKFPPASSLAEVPDGFDAWFARAVARDAADRFASARVMAEELRGLCGQMPMLWEHEAAPPVQHTTREKTELEPVLELTRRARSSRAPRPPDPRFPITEVDSVLPMLRTPPPPKRHTLRWTLTVAVFIGFIGSTVVWTPTLRPASVDRMAARVREVAASLRRSTPVELAPASVTAASGQPAPGHGAAAPAPSTQRVSSLQPAPDDGPDAGAPRPDAGNRF